MKQILRIWLDCFLEILPLILYITFLVWAFTRGR